MILVEGLSKRFGSVQAVKDLSFHVKAGQIVGLLGPNGAGKTTAMRCISGIAPADSGTVHIAGISLDDDSVEAKSRLAFVPSEPRLFDYLTVREHLGFFARLYAAVTKEEKPYQALFSERTRDAETLIQELDLMERADYLPAALSRGMKQKLMVACALIHQPDVLIFDEPFTGLDPHAIRKMKTILQAHISKGSAVLISSHLLGMVEGLVSHVLIVSRGQKLVEGTMSELRKQLAHEHQDADLEEIFIQLTSEPKQEAEV